MEFTATREVLASLYEQTSTPTFLCDRDGQVIAANAAAQALSGCEHDELLGRGCGDIFKGAEDVGSAVMHAFLGERGRFEAEVGPSGAAPTPVECDVFPASLGGAITGVFVQARLIQNAFADKRTGLPNRVLLDERIEQCIVMARRYRHDFALMYVQADAGNPAEIGERIRSWLRESDTLARVGENTFAILQPMIEDAEDAADLARKIRLAEVRIGIARFPDDGEDARALHSAAQRSLETTTRVTEPAT